MLHGTFVVHRLRHHKLQLYPLVLATTRRVHRVKLSLKLVRQLHPQISATGLGEVVSTGLLSIWAEHR